LQDGIRPSERDGSVAAQVAAAKGEILHSRKTAGDELEVGVGMAGARDAEKFSGTACENTAVKPSSANGTVSVGVTGG